MIYRYILSITLVTEVVNIGGVDRLNLVALATPVQMVGYERADSSPAYFDVTNIISPALISEYAPIEYLGDIISGPTDGGYYDATIALRKKLLEALSTGAQFGLTNSQEPPNNYVAVSGSGTELIIGISGFNVVQPLSFVQCVNLTPNGKLASLFDYIYGSIEI